MKLVTEPDGLRVVAETAQDAAYLLALGAGGPLEAALEVRTLSHAAMPGVVRHAVGLRLARPGGVPVECGPDGSPADGQLLRFAAVIVATALGVPEADWRRLAELPGLAEGYRRHMRLIAELRRGLEG